MKILITEFQLNKLLLEEHPSSNKFKEPFNYLSKGYIYESSNLFQQRVLKNNGKEEGPALDEFMEKYREGLFSPVGMAIEVLLTSFEYTAPIVVDAYGAMLAYDIFKSLNGQTNWFNIIIDVICVVTSGLAAGTFSPLMKYSKSGFSSIAKVFEWLKTTKIWTKIVPFLENVLKGIGVVAGYIGKGLNWIAKQTGISFLAKWSSNIVGFFNKIITGILDAVGSATGKVASKLGGSTKLTTATANATKVGVANQAIMSGLETKPGQNLVSYLTPNNQNMNMNDIQNIKPSQHSLEVTSKINFSQ
jgi:hypothetical protein